VLVKTDTARSIHARSKFSRHMGRLILLGLMFVACTAYYVRVTMYREPHWFGWHPVARPFFVGGLAEVGPENYPRISFLIHAPLAAGLKPDDVLLEVNGRKVKGAAVVGEVLRHAKDGDVMTVKVARFNPEGAPGQASQATIRKKDAEAFGRKRHEERTVSFRLTTEDRGRWLDHLSQATLLIFLPFVSMLIGFWVAGLRSQDPLGWLVLALMLCFVAFGDPNVMTWPRYLRDLGVLFRTGSNSLFAIWLLLFGIYFPEPFPASSPRTKWLKLKWALIVPLSGFALVHMIFSMGYLENLASIRSLVHLPQALNITEVCLTYMAQGLGVTLIASKYRAAVSADAKRRLRLLAAGAAVTMSPFFVVQAYAIIRGVNPELEFPKVVWFGADVLFFTFPIVLAYVIVVHRAMDVRFVFRQGLQYALAKNGVRVIQFIFTAIALLAAVRLISNSGSNPWLKLLVIAAGLGLIPLIQSSADRLRNWVDARFFREAYNAENVLNELSDQVRTMVQPQSLLETVVARISETLHVSKIAVLLDSGNPFRPVYAVGYSGMPQLQFAPSAGCVKLLRAQKEPLRVYPDDENSWLYREENVTAESEKN
jgi:sigma-B regulation protein RsbU (phosphoserine phosphatase)